MALIRCFFCLPLPEELRLQAERWILKAQRQHPFFRWTGPENLHVTLRFCGEIPAPQLRQLSDLLKQRLAGRPQRAFSLVLGKLGTFGRPVPRVLWSGLEDHQKQLAHFQRTLESCCQEAGLEPAGRPFSPHLTLARIGPGRSPNTGWLDRMPPWLLAGQVWYVPASLLMRSHLTPQGPRYVPLERYDFPVGS